MFKVSNTVPGFRVGTVNDEPVSVSRTLLRPASPMRCPCQGAFWPAIHTYVLPIILVTSTLGERRTPLLPFPLEVGQCRRSFLRGRAPLGCRRLWRVACNRRPQSTLRNYVGELVERVPIVYINAQMETGCRRLYIQPDHAPRSSSLVSGPLLGKALQIPGKG
jgi:hypothetical protein